MTAVITHSVLTGDLVDATADVDGTAWDADHVITGEMDPSQGGTGIANNAASTITISGSFGTTFTITADTSVTLPTTGTLATLAGAEALTNKTYNGNTWTAGSGTLTIAAAKVLTASNTLTVTATDGSTAAFGVGGTVAYKGLSLAQFASTTSAELRTLLSDESGTGAAYFQGGDIGTPSAGVLTNATGLPLAGVTGTWTIARGGTGQTTQQAAYDALAPTATRAGDITYWNGTHYVSLAGNNSGTKILQEDASGVPSWASPGTGTVTASGTPVLGQMAKWTSATDATGINWSVTPQGRLTLTSATPVLSATVSAATTIYYALYVGQLVPICDGTRMVPTVFTELSVATTDTTKSPAAIGASKVNDWFVWSDSGTLRLGHGPDWTSDTARSAGTALTMVNGILVNNASITNGPNAGLGTYVGTTRSDSSSKLNWILGAAASGGTAAVLGVWNCYNRVEIGTTVTDNGVAYTYTTATIRQARASAGNQISFVLGLTEDSVIVSHATRIDTLAVALANASVGFGFDSTSAYSLQNWIAFDTTANAAIYSPAISGLWNGLLGYHTLSANEKGDGTNAATFNNNNTANLNVAVRM